MTRVSKSKKQASAAKKRQKYWHKNRSSSPSRSHGNEEHHDEKQIDVVCVEEGIEPEHINDEPIGKSYNEGSSSSNGNILDNKVCDTKNCRRTEDTSSIENVNTEISPLSDENVKNESLLEDVNEKKSTQVGISVERNGEGVLQSDDQAELEIESTVTEPLKKTSWRNFCGMFEVFSRVWKIEQGGDVNCKNGLCSRRI